MIQLLFEYKDIAVLREVMQGTEEAPSEFNLPVITIPEMLEDMYFTLIEPEAVTSLENALQQPPLKMIVAGSFNEYGTQYIWTEPTEINRNHSIDKYKNKLKDVVEYDENGDEVSRRRPTELEALNTQVNKVYGWNNRTLE